VVILCIVVVGAVLDLLVAKLYRLRVVGILGLVVAEGGLVPMSLWLEFETTGLTWGPHTLAQRHRRRSRTCLVDAGEGFVELALR